MAPFALFVSKYRRCESTQGYREMLDATVLEIALSAFSTMFGSLGVFCTYLSFLQPSLGAQALVFLTVATAIVWSSPQT
jgi:hypothetical protein